MNPRADVGPKPTPTPRPSPAPGPTGPGRSGHLPIGADLPDLPDLLDLLDGVELLGARMIGLLKRGYDPADDGYAVPAHVGIRLMRAAADVRSALAMLQQIRTSSSVRQVPEVRIATTGGPLTTGPTAGECLTPGYAAADVASAARESVGVPAPTQAMTRPPRAAGVGADTPSRTTGFPAVVEAPGSSEAVPGAGVQLLTRAEVADLFGVDAQTIWSWRRSGRLDCVRPGGGYRESDVLALLAADRVVKTGASP